ncbi:MAG: type II toxin-antitoxin system VapC family toxin [Nitrospirae bacterium]|nr:type II toxin-antitoxin system VapC family toxin [Nitrospirota bacterium]
MRFYLDSSTILRAVFGEAGPTPRVGQGDQVYTSEIAEVEVFRTLDRARLAGKLTDAETAIKAKELSERLTAVRLVPVAREVIETARAGFPVPVRALDALHVATAQWLQRELGEDLRFWTHDRRQAIAALARGLNVEGVSVQ